MDTLIRPKDLATKLGISIPTLYRRMKEPDFPRKVQISTQSVGFRETEVQEWIESKQTNKGNFSGMKCNVSVS